MRREDPDFAEGPWGAPGPPPRRRRPWRQWLRRYAAAAVPVALFLLIAGPAFKDLARPEAWAYWKDLYLSPSLTASVFPDAYRDASGHDRSVIAVTGRIGAAAAGWFRTQLDNAHLAPGDVVALASPGGDLDQGLIMGEIIRARGLLTAVGHLDAGGLIKPAYCASACVLAFAGGTVRIGIPASRLGVHRFTSTGAGRDAVADTQRTTGLVLSYMMRMGVAPSVIEAMAATDRIRWLTPEEAVTMKLVTDPVSAP